MSADRFVKEDIFAYALGDGRFLACFPDERRPVVMSERTLKSLWLCDSSDTLDGHAERLRKLWPSTEMAQARKELKSLASSGLLVSISSFLESVAVCSHTEALRKPIHIIGIPTRNWSQQVDETVHKWLDHCVLHHRDLVLVVAKNSDGLKDSYVPVELRGKCEVREIGTPERTLFISHLVAEGIPVAVATFALNGDGEVRIGANRNCILLDCIGERLLMADDDVHCDTVKHPSADGTVRFVGHNVAPFDLKVYRNRRDALLAGARDDFDILAAHEKLLGRRCSEIARDPAFSKLELIGVCHELVEATRSGCGRVRATMGGFVGDNGRGFREWSLYLPPHAARALLGRSEKEYQTALDSREILQIARGYTVTHSGFCMTLNLGIDVSEMVPPFMPSFRNEDGLFGTMLTSLTADAFMGHVPYGIAHVPPAGKSYPQEKAGFMRMPRMADLTGSLVARAPVGRDENDCAEALNRTGKYLIWVASRKKSTYLALVTRLVQERLASILKAAQGAVVVQGTSYVPWRNDLQSQCETFMHAAAAGVHRIPFEFQQTADPISEGMAYLRKFGELLTWWPHIWTAADTLKRKGVRLSRPLPQRG